MSPEYDARIAHGDLNGSVLHLKNKSLADDEVRRNVHSRFRNCGIDVARVVLLTPEELKVGHLQRYAGIDIALDTFPYHGTTTTCEALWMGVPVITRIGAVHRSRVGLTLLDCAGLRELAADGDCGYVRAAVRLANRLHDLARLRRELRSTMRRSALMDGNRFVANLESAYRQMYDSICPVTGTPPNGGKTDTSQVNPLSGSGVAPWETSS